MSSFSKHTFTLTRVITCPWLVFGTLERKIKLLSTIFLLIGINIVWLFESYGYKLFIGQGGRAIMFCLFKHSSNEYGRFVWLNEHGVSFSLPWQRNLSLNAVCRVFCHHGWSQPLLSMGRINSHVGGNTSPASIWREGVSL